MNPFKSTSFVSNKILLSDTNRMLAAKAKISGWGNIALLTFALGSIGLSNIHITQVIIFSILFCCSVGRLLCGHFHLTDKVKSEVLWSHLYSTATLGTAICWATLAVTHFNHHALTSESSVLLIVITAGVGSGVTVSLSADLFLARMFLFITAIPMVVAIFFHHTHPYYSLALVIAAYLIFLLAQVRVQHRILWDLHSKTSKLRAIIDATREPIIIHEEGIITEANPAIHRLYGYEVNELIGKSVMDLTPPEVFDVVRNQIKQGLEGPIHTSGLKKDGTRFPLVADGMWFVHEGRRIRVSCIQDLTNIIATEKALLETASQKQILLEERERAATESAKLKGQFLANMSHEIRTPLNAIIGITDLISENPSDDRQRKYLRLLKESGESLLNLINDILDFSKIDADKIELEEIAFSISGVIEGQAELLANRARQKGVMVHTMVDPNLPVSVLGDYGRVGQILLNMINNAIKFTKQGSIWIRAEVNGYQGDKVVVRFEVQDSGIGIKEDIGRKLFSPFTQADSSTARKYGGTGLGLSICRKLVEIMDGNIGFTSPPSGGTIFWFDIPFHLADGRRMSETFTKKELVNTRCAIISDELPGAKVIKTYLDSWQLSADIKSLGNFKKLMVENSDPFDVVLVAGSDPSDALLDFVNELSSAQRNFKIIRVQNSQNPLEMNPNQDPHDMVRGYIPVPVRQSDLFNAIANAVLRTPVKDLAEAEKPIAQADDFLQGTRILVAEDNSTNQMIILAALRRLGAHCHAVGNGLEAIDALNQSEYDLVLMDCQMPELDGFEATKRIRELEKISLSRVPIIALTANVLKEERERCFECGMDDFLSKPVRKEKLVHMLKTQLAK